MALNLKQHGKDKKETKEEESFDVGLGEFYRGAVALNKKNDMRLILSIFAGRVVRELSKMT